MVVVVVAVVVVTVVVVAAAAAAAAAAAVVLILSPLTDFFFKYLFLAFCSLSPVSVIINLQIFLSLS
jgi:hypothetical protein